MTSAGLAVLMSEPTQPTRGHPANPMGMAYLASCGPVSRPYLDSASAVQCHWLASKAGHLAVRLVTCETRAGVKWCELGSNLHVPARDSDHCRRSRRIVPPAPRLTWPGLARPSPAAHPPARPTPTSWPAGGAARWTHPERAASPTYGQPTSLMSGRVPVAAARSACRVLPDR